MYKAFVGILTISLGCIWHSDTFASSSSLQDAGDIYWPIFLILLSGLVGYVLGSIKSFREEKQKAYGAILPPILKMAYHPESTTDEKEFCEALSKLWVYGSKKVAMKMEEALSIIHNPGKGNITEALQRAVVEMRRDVQLWTWQRLNPQDVNHLYSRISGNN
jgi:hypothetical protein